MAAQSVKILYGIHTVHYHAHNSIPLDPVLSRTYPPHIEVPCCSNIHLGGALACTVRTSKFSLSLKILRRKLREHF